MSDDRLSLYPEIAPYHTGRLRVSSVHDLYFEECGNPAGKPVLMVHGGPGGGSNPTMRRFHDPSLYRIVLFDQRGCGRSTPYASLEENTTWHLVSDMEALREELGIAQWQLCGGSWGSALSLAYAETHPDCVTELILRGVFTLRRSEVAWFYQEGTSWLYPDAFEDFVAPIPEDERGDLIEAYHRRLTGEDEAVQRACAQAWSLWEGRTLSLYPDARRERIFTTESYALAFARIECHYFVNRGFFDSDDQLIANAHILRCIPCVIVQGRYDVVTPMRTAWDLHCAWPEAELRIAQDSGHAMTEPGIVHEIVSASWRFASTGS